MQVHLFAYLVLRDCVFGKIERQGAALQREYIYLTIHEALMSIP